MIPASPDKSMTVETNINTDTEVDKEEDELQEKECNLQTVGTKSDMSVDKLERLQTIGTGTFGRVYLVKNKQTSEYFALKCLKKIRNC